MIGTPESRTAHLIPRHVRAWVLLVCATGTWAPAFGQPLPPAPACKAATAAPPDERLAAKIAAVDTQIDDRKPVVWPKLADLAQYACAVGNRAAVDKAFLRCFRECADEHDLYAAHLYYAAALERFGDVLGAENQFIDAIAVKPDPADALAAFTGYAALLERQGRPREALDLLNRLPPNSGAAAGAWPVKLRLMRELGMDLSGVTPPARPPGGFPTVPIDPPPSAIPVEDNPRAQSPFAIVVEVTGDVWIEPKAGVQTEQPGHLYYHRASMPNPATFKRILLLKQGERFLVVAPLAGNGCRIAVEEVRYDIESCPWRSGDVGAETLFRVADERVPSPPAVRVRPRSPLSPEESGSSPAPEWAVWRSLYDAMRLSERQGSNAYATAMLEEKAGLTPAQAEAVRAAGDEYLRQLARLDADIRSEIARTGPPDAARIAEFDERMNAQLRAHLASLAQRIGAAELAALEDVVRREIAPGVLRTGGAAPAVSPAGR